MKARAPSAFPCGYADGRRVAGARTLVALFRITAVAPRLGRGVCVRTPIPSVSSPASAIRAAAPYTFIDPLVQLCGGRDVELRRAGPAQDGARGQVHE